ncbi:hypothetical protein [Sphingobacterium siyangense]|uniref:hypothetical protein n=1 Tax=Sphingobacterium siyangense TaxID=459529 RepID=UPI002FDEC57A
MVMVLKVYGCSSPWGGYGTLCMRKRELRPFSYLGTDLLHRSWSVPGQVGFCGYGGRRTYKNTTCTIQNKKQGLYRKGQKSGFWGYFSHIDAGMED